MAGRSRISSFAQKQLEKHGWKSGQGLGKTESGISEAIKVKIKQDTAGVGHDAGEQFTYHWWDHVFNKAASNIVVETDQDGVKLSRKEATQGPISNKKESGINQGKKPLLYGNFVRSVTMTTEGEQHDSQNVSLSSSDEDQDGGSPEVENIDERFFKACGGRTAHKGARHGLTLSGKLKRIQAQEEGHHLPRPPKENNDVCSLSPSHEGASKGQGKKQRKKDRKRESEETASGDKDCKKRNKKCKKLTVENGNFNPNAYSTDDKHKMSGVLESGITDDHEYLSDRPESQELIIREDGESKAARKAKKAKRTREKRSREMKSTVCEDQITNGHLYSRQTATTKKSKKKKSKQTAL